MKIRTFTYLLIYLCLNISAVGMAQSTKKNLVKAASTKDRDKVFMKVERHLSFPGGANSWFTFANDNLDYAAILKDQPSISTVFRDSVVVKFIVDRFGAVSDFEVVKGNPALGGAVINLLKETPPWIPEEQCGRKVKAYKALRVDVFIDTENNIHRVERLKNSYDYSG